jgi:hypothetical protein
MDVSNQSVMRHHAGGDGEKLVNSSIFCFIDYPAVHRGVTIQKISNT